MTVPVTVINILHCCLYKLDIITVYYKHFTAMLLNQILYQINNIAIGYTIYINQLKCFEISCTQPDIKNAIDLNPCRQDAPLSVTDYRKWNLNL